MNKVIFHPKNAERRVKIKLKNQKKKDEIAQILSSKKQYRIASEIESGGTVPIVDYLFTDIVETEGVTVSFDNGKTWVDVHIKENKIYNEVVKNDGTGKDTE